MEQKYKMGNEYGSLLWDISMLLEDVEKYPIKTFSTQELAKVNSFHGDAAYAMSTDLSKPLIIIQLSETKDKLIDGNHRLYKALHSGIEFVKCYYLTISEQQKYIIDFDAESYQAIIGHL